MNIQDNAFGQENNVQVDKAREARRKNFFEKKRFINYPYSNPTEDPDSSDNNANSKHPPGSANENIRGATNVNSLNQRKRFDDLQI